VKQEDDFIQYQKEMIQAKAGITQLLVSAEMNEEPPIAGLLSLLLAA